MSRKEVNEQEIQEHLKALNLATLADERAKRRDWFRAQKIELVEIETFFYLVPQGIKNAYEMLTHVHRANMHLEFLANELRWLKEHQYEVKLLQKGGKKQYEFIQETCSKEEDVVSINKEQ